VDAQGQDWDAVIKTVIYAIRNSYHTAVQRTPFEVFMGRPVREPIDLIFNKVGVSFDLADNEMINQPVRLRQMYDEVRQFSADLLRDSTSSRLKLGMQLALKNELCYILAEVLRRQEIVSVPTIVEAVVR
jgi:hypothetical protein